MKFRKSSLLVLTLVLSAALFSLALATAVDRAARSSRERTYVDAARQAAACYEVPLAIVMAVLRTESDFRADAVSPAGAVGLMQLMPETFRFIRDERLGEALADSAILDPETNIRYGTYYLAYLFERFDSWFVALAAYNAGEGRVEEWLLDPELSSDGRLQTIPFPETAAYVEKTIDAYHYYGKKYKS